LNKDAFAVIDFGSETTIINILRNKILEFNKVILSGSSNLDEAIAKNMRKSIIEAERLRNCMAFRFRRTIPPTRSI